MDSVKSFSGGLVALAFLVIAYQYIMSPAAGSFMSAVHTRDAAFAGAKAADLKNRETAFKTVCPQYRDASYLQRIIGFRKIAWCADYISKL